MSGCGEPRAVWPAHSSGKRTAKPSAIWSRRRNIATSTGSAARLTQCGRGAQWWNLPCDGVHRDSGNSGRQAALRRAARARQHSLEYVLRLSISSFRNMLGRTDRRPPPLVVLCDFARQINRAVPVERMLNFADRPGMPHRGIRVVLQCESEPKRGMPGCGHAPEFLYELHKWPSHSAKASRCFDALRGCGWRTGRRIPPGRQRHDPSEIAHRFRGPAGCDSPPACRTRCLRGPSTATAQS